VNLKDHNRPRVLVIGAGGFVGKNMVEFLSNNFEVIGFRSRYLNISKKINEIKVMCYFNFDSKRTI
jgi:nucleoside-diphosphate-sugar epimerase